ncbi:family 25 glycosyltransferase [Cryphonectria parasitica EP155]|uniref:Family 25 glycosyltransferase n=1 Tax=Cryphonectria parasitica (strain ATCC 38755 / EP155) TaxID=660469 RepID=A0A9P4XZG2_CRYP1|nr:family 25 glycosyltransferase [Cryphonectria parasitica EP155]KAF3763615.1 family 25 glycosyltransferase [Cryphonectria parasitica EP155]
MILVRTRLIATVAVSIAVISAFYLLRPNRPLPLYFTSSIQTKSSTTTSSPNEKPYGRDYRGHAEPADINRVANGTLGFGKVFVVGLPERTDKRDAMTLSSSLTGFDVEWVDGVRGDSIPDKAVPFGVNRKKLMETNLGSWRGHMNAIRRIVEQNLDSALIMEDDMDWDVRLKPQLELLASGARAVMSSLPDAFFPTGRPSTAASSSSSSPDSAPNSPYGDDWDILWLGHCGEPFPEDLVENKDLPPEDRGRKAMARKWTILNDATVPPYDHLTGIVDFAAHPEHTRWVHVTAAPICTFAYAVSLHGARKILYDLSVDRLSGPFDNALAWLCRRAVGSWAGLGRGEDPNTLGDRGFDAKCLSITPPLFFHHKAKGLVNADSDIQNYGGGGGGDNEKPPEIRDKGKTENIMWSARMNIANMIAGREMESQF